LAQADEAVVDNDGDKAEHDDGDNNPKAHILYSP
jgi:hypothetical protein